MKDKSMINREDVRSFLAWIEEHLRKGEKIPLPIDEEKYLNSQAAYTVCEVNLEKMKIYKLYYNDSDKPLDEEVSTIHKIRRIAVIVFIDKVKKESHIIGMKKKYIIPSKTEEIILYQGNI